MASEGSGPGAPKREDASEPRHEELRIRPPHHRSFLGRWGLLLFGIGIVVIGGAAVVLVAYLKPPSQPATVFTIAPPPGVEVGVPFTLSLSAANDSRTDLSGAVVAVQLPQGVEFVGNGPSTQVQEYSLGDIASGAVASQSSTIIVTGAPSQLYAISAKLLYSTPETPSTTYETDQATSITPGPSTFSLSYSAPTNIVSGQSFPVTVNYANNGSQPIADARIALQYPPAYAFTTSSVPTATGTAASLSFGTWDVGTLAPGQGGSFIVTGAIVGPSQAQYQLQGTAYIALGGRQYPANVQTVNFTLVPSPLELAVSVNGSTDYISKTGDSLSYTLTYTNNSAVTLSSVKITTALSGRMYDFGSLQTAGAFDSRTNTITWSAANAPGLASVAPGQSGSVSFNVKTLSAFPIRLPSDKNYSLSVTGKIESPTVIPGASGSSTISVVKASNKIAGQMAFASEGHWLSGPYPPKVNQESQYTIDWKITNYATDASSVTVSAYLQSGTSFLGAASSTGTASVPVYDPGTGLVTWTVPFIPATTGITDAPMEARFTVANIPAVNQVGSDVTLLSNASLAASDTWTGGSFSITVDPVTTALPNEPSLAGGSARTVTQ